MKMFLLVVVLVAAIGSGIPSLAYAESRQLTGDDLGKRVEEVVSELNKSAALAAEKAGVKKGSISCDPSFIVCTCEGALNCAWLAWACSEAGGIRGFEGECFLPSSVPGTKVIQQNFKRLADEASTNKY